MSLLRWLFSERCAYCGLDIGRGSKACRHCGRDVSDSWRNCSVCGNDVAADSRHCWECKSDLTAQPRDQIVSDRWRPVPGVLAVRIPIETPEKRLRHGVQVDAGTRGGFFRNGMLLHELHASGQLHEASTFMQRLLSSGPSGNFVDAVIVTTQPFDLLVDVTRSAGAMTSDHVRVEAAALLRVQVQDLSRVQQAMLPFGTDVAREADVAARLSIPLENVICQTARRHTAEALLFGPGLDEEVAPALQHAMHGTLQVLGLSFCGLMRLRVGGEDLENVRTRIAGLAAMERGNGWSQRQRHLEQMSQFSNISSETELREKIARVAHDACLLQSERDHLLRMRKIAYGHAEGMAVADSEGNIAVLRAEYELKLRRMKHEAEMREDAADWGLLLKMKEDKAKAKADLTIAVARGLDGLSPMAIIAGVDMEKGAQLLEALNALQPKHEVIVAKEGLAHAGNFATTGHGLEHWANEHLSGVGVVVIPLPAGAYKVVGTAWVVHGTKMLATNAHVARAVLTANREAGTQAHVLFPGARLAVEHADLHSGYRHEHLLPSHDVAIIQVQGELPHTGLPVAPRKKLLSLRRLQPVAYLGYPTEGLVGGGVHLDRPKAMAKAGRISAMRDWLLGDGPAAEMHLIEHDIGVAGGASGSPLLNEDGEVVGIVSAGNMQLSLDPTTRRLRRDPHAVMVNFAQRLDVLLDWKGWS